MTKKKWVILPALLLVIQVFRPERANPETASDLALGGSGAPQQVHRILESACFGCHSNQTVWPWYSTVAPVSWLIADDVKRGRRELNFSEWERYDAGEKAHLLKEVGEVVREGEMPPWTYRLLHSEARLSEADVAALAKWAEQQRQKLTATTVTR
ncbi:MAG: heme-binding domain-containing protein [Acidobacteriota bacterium]